MRFRAFFACVLLAGCRPAEDAPLLEDTGRIPDQSISFELFPLVAGESRIGRDTSLVWSQNDDRDTISILVLAGRHTGLQSHTVEAHLLFVDVAADTSAAEGRWVPVLVSDASDTTQSALARERRLYLRPSEFDARLSSPRRAGEFVTELRVTSIGARGQARSAEIRMMWPGI